MGIKSSKYGIFTVFLVYFHCLSVENPKGKGYITWVYCLNNQLRACGREFHVKHVVFGNIRVLVIGGV